MGGDACETCRCKTPGVGHALTCGAQFQSWSDSHVVFVTLLEILNV